MTRDEGIRETSLEKLGQLKPVAREDGVHTAGTAHRFRWRSSGADDDSRACRGTRAHPRARVVDTCLVGVDPVLMLTGPMDATRRLLDRSGLSIDDIDNFEINEASHQSFSRGQKRSEQISLRPTQMVVQLPSATPSGRPVHS